MEMQKRFKTKNDVIKELERIRLLREGEISTIEKELEGLFHGLHLNTPLVPAGNLYFRVQKADPFDEEFHKISRLSYPPNHLAKLGRANNVGKPMFYCSNSFRSPFLELNLKSGDQVVLGWWQQVRPALVQVVGFYKEVLEKFGTIREEVGSWEENIDSLILGKLGEFFLSDSEGYKFSIATKNRLMRKLSLKKPLPYDDEVIEDFSGLVYPSVPFKGKTDNYAFSKDFADTGLRLLRADYCQINSICRDTKSINLTFLKHSTHVSKTFIHWKENNDGYPVWFANTDKGPIGFGIFNGRFSKVIVEPYVTTPSQITPL